MLNYADFKVKYLGVRCGDTDANFGECVGLAELWIDNLNLGHVWGNAKDIFDVAPATDYLKTVYKKGVFPVTGDIITWNKTWGGGFGHIAIIDSVDKVANTFTVLEQNNPLHNPPRVHTYTSWSGVIGWLHPYVLDQISTTNPSSATSDNTLQQQLDDMRTSRNAWKDKCNEYEGAITTLNQTITDLKAKIETLQLSVSTNKTPLSEYSTSDKLASVLEDIKAVIFHAK